MVKILKTQRCRHCGSRASSEATICPKCGNALERGGRLRSARCLACGARLAPGQSVCPICGAVHEQRGLIPWGRLVRGLLGLGLVVACGAAIWNLKPWRQLSLSLGTPTPSLAIVMAVPSPSPTYTTTATPTETATRQPTLTSTPLPSLTPTSLYVRYTVARGDSLSVIAKKYNVAVEDLQRINGMTNQTILAVGQRVLVPRDAEGPELTPTPTPTPTRGELVHEVVSGDTLGGLAVQYDISSREIAEANNIDMDSVLSLGQKLVIPGMTVTPTPTAQATATMTPTRTPQVLNIVRQPTSQYPYRRVRLLGPVDGARLDGRAGSVMLNWTSVGVLAEDEWYLLRLTRGSEEPITIRTRMTSWRVTRSMYPDEANAALRAWRFRWEVRVIRHDTVQSQATPLSPLSISRSFTWG